MSLCPPSQALPNNFRSEFFRRFLWASSIVCSLSVLACEPTPNKNQGEGGHALPRGNRPSGKLPHLNSVPAFSLTNQRALNFGSAELKGTPYLVAFVFTRCPSVCPSVMKRMKEVDEAMKKASKKLNLVSISVDPENDTPEVLTAYAKKYGADVPNWTLLTGSHRTILHTAEEGFKVGLAGSIDEKKEHLGITHGSHFVLVDSQGSIRGYYRSSEKGTVSALVHAMDNL